MYIYFKFEPIILNKRNFKSKPTQHPQPLKHARIKVDHVEEFDHKNVTHPQGGKIVISK